MFFYGQGDTPSAHEAQRTFNLKFPNHRFFSARGASKMNLKKVNDIPDTYEIFAWYPYWDQSYYKEMNYDLLSTIAYFSYHINPNDGSSKVENEWLIDRIVDSAKVHQNKVLLTLTNFGSTANSTLLNNAGACTRLISDIVTANASHQTNGVCLDFEGIAGKDSTAFTRFVHDLRAALTQQNRQNLLYNAIPSVDWKQPWLFDSLVQSVDKFIIMGYNYYSSSSSKAGPNSPLNSGTIWAANNLTSSVDYYLNKHIPANQLILALPFYGQAWTTASKTIGASAEAYIGSMTYSSIQNQKIKGSIEAYSQSAYFMSQKSSQAVEQYWYENDSSFQVKLELLKQKGLAGLGIWALGYDKGYSELWTTISSSLSSPESIDDQILGDTTSIVQSIEKNLKGVVSYQNVLLYTCSLLAIFGALGIVLALLFPETRIYFFSQTAIRNGSLLVVLLLLVVIFELTGVLNHSSMILIYGFLLGIVSYYLLSKYIQKRKKELP